MSRNDLEIAPRPSLPTDSPVSCTRRSVSTLADNTARFLESPHDPPTLIARALHGDAWSEAKASSDPCGTLSRAPCSSSQYDGALSGLLEAAHDDDDDDDVLLHSPDAPPDAAHTAPRRPRVDARRARRRTARHRHCHPGGRRARGSHDGP
ncbi:hypothetical protein ACG7TL_008692 [Trametes sanguinea]